MSDDLVQQSPAQRQRKSIFSRLRFDALQVIDWFPISVALIFGVIVVVVSVLSMWLWAPLSSPAPSVQLRFEARFARPDEVSDGPPTLDLISSEKMIVFETRMSELPVWVKIPLDGVGVNRIVEFNSKHAVAVTCWAGPRRDRVGTATLDTRVGPVRSARTGFAVDVPNEATELLCQIRSIGPAFIRAAMWSAAGFADARMATDRSSSLLEGALLGLAVFYVLVGILNRSWLYFLFSGWLVVAFLGAVLSVGNHDRWLGNLVPANYILAFRSQAHGWYAVLLAALSLAMFRDELRRLQERGLVLFPSIVSSLILLSSFVLGREEFLRVLWLLGAPSIIAMIWVMFKLYSFRVTLKTLFFGAALGVTLLANLWEIIAKLVENDTLVLYFNATTAAVVSAMLTSLAIAWDVRDEYLRRVDAQQRLQHAYDGVPVGMFTLREDGAFVSFNSTLRGMLESFSTDDFMRRHSSWSTCFGEESWSALCSSITSKSEGEFEFEPPRRRAIDERVTYLVRVARKGDLIEGSLQDVTDKKRLLMDLSHMADHDSLTNALNRRGLYRLLAELDDPKKDGPLALAYLDLDRFKLINDMHGHAAGDAVLADLVGRVRSALPPDAALARIGGDEFVVVMRGLDTPRAAQECAEIIRVVSEQPFSFEGKSFHVRVSIGLSDMVAGDSPSEALSLADGACRLAKSGGGDGRGLAVLDRAGSHFREYQSRLRVVERLLSEPLDFETQIQLQPLTAVQSGQLVLAEALLRVVDGNGVVVPASFIVNSATEFGRMSRLDLLVLESAVRWLTANAAQLRAEQLVCVNLADGSLTDDQFLLDFESLLEKNAAAARHLCLEINEKALVRDSRNTQRFIERCHTLGPLVAIDHFGAGYGSLTHLMAARVDFVKFDTSVAASSTSRSLALLKPLLLAAQGLGVRTVALGVEDSAQIEALTGMGVDYVQGWGVGEILCPHEFFQDTPPAAPAPDYSAPAASR